MLCLIGDFEFTVEKTSFDTFSTNITYPFATIEKVGDYNSYQDTGKHEQNDSISGLLIAKSIRTFDSFEALAAKKEPVTISFSTGVAYTVLILYIQKTRSAFLRDGSFLKMSYQIELTKVGQW